MKLKSSRILWISGIAFALISILLMFLPRLVIENSWWPLNASESTGHMGDTIGGIMGPYVALLAAALTFMAFFIQYQANEQIANQFKYERLENKFYESLKVHKDNVQEINIGGKHNGRKSFVWMYKEFRFIYLLTKSIYGEILAKRISNGKSTKNFNYDEKKLAHISYIIFFFGVGEISNMGTKYYIGEFDKELNEKVIKSLLKLQKKFANKPEKVEWVRLKSKYISSTLDVNFEPFDGHVAKLGHYFRHLYQLIKFATTDPILNREDPVKEKNIRYEYVKQIRVQLSNHEQAMIYYNSFFDAGKVWWGDETIEKKIVFNGMEYPLSYFLDYKMIKNIPFNLTSGLGPDPRQEFFCRFLERGYNLNSKEERNNLKKHLQNDFFEWGFKNKYFKKCVKIYLS